MSNRWAKPVLAKDTADAAIDAAAMDSNITTATIGMGAADKVCFHNRFTGSTPTGAFTYEGSADPDAADWVVLTVSTVHGDGNPAGSAGDSMVIVADCPPYVRQVFTDSGSAAADKLTTWISKRE